MAFRKTLVHCIAACQDCAWYSEDYLTAQVTARKHHLKTGHKISLDLGYAAYYEVTKYFAAAAQPEKVRDE